MIGWARDGLESRTVIIAAASTTIPAMISNTSNCGRAITATRPVEFTVALCMERRPTLSSAASP